MVLNSITDSAHCRRVQVDGGCECISRTLAVMDFIFFILHGPDSAESEPVLKQKMSAIMRITSLGGQVFI